MITFPATPYAGLIFSAGTNRWTYNGVTWDLLPNASDEYVTGATLTSTLANYTTQDYVSTLLANSANIYVGAQPSTTTDGSLWFSSSTQKLYVYYSSAWVEVTPDEYTLLAATTSTLGGVIIPAVATSGITNSAGTIGLAVATSSQLGGVTIPAVVTSGIINASGAIRLAMASSSQLGAVMIPAVATSGITNSNGTIGLAIASVSQLGGVKVDGSTIIIANGSISAVAPELDGLADVNVTGVTDGAVLKYSTDQSKWIAASDLTGTGGAGISLSNLSVSTALASGSGSLAYNNGTGVFTFTPPSLSAYATTASLSSYATTASLSAYATTSSVTALVPSQATHAGQYLRTDGTSTNWQSVTLAALTDVNVTGAADGEVLKYSTSAGKWVAAADLQTSGGGGVSLASFSVTTASASGSGSLAYNNGTGVFTFTPPSITTYTLPTASTSTLGGVKVDGSTITINGSGVISSTASGGITSILAGSYIGVSTVGSVVTITNNLSRLNFLTDADNCVINGSNLTVDKIAIHAVTTYDVLPQNPTAYLFLSHFSTANPTLYALSGTTIAFNLQVPGHPFVLQTSGGVDLVWTTVNTYGTLTHISTSGVVSKGAAAMGQTTGTLYWSINPSTAGTFKYQCTIHPLMVGSIVIKSITTLA